LLIDLNYGMELRKSRYGIRFVYFLVIVILNHTIGTAYAQSEENDLLSIKGSPEIKHFNKDDYNSDSQFWCMTEDDRGIMYFGNNDGVVIFDGERWELIKLPNGSTVRSLKYASDGNVYAGGINEIGTIQRDQYGNYYYESLNGFLRPEDQNFEDVWQIIENKGHIIFRSFKMLIALKGRNAITIPSTDRFSYLNEVNDELFVVDNWGIKKLNVSTMEFDEVVAANAYRNETIVGIFQGIQQEELFVFTKDGFSYLLNLQEGKADLFRNHLPDESTDEIFCAINSDKKFYLGTINNQVIELNFQHSADPVEREIRGLQDNTVLSLGMSHQGNIWAMLNKGIDCIEMATPMTLIFEDAAIYDMIQYKDRLYVATNQGVYAAELKGDDQFLLRRDFDIIPGLEAQAWSLSVLEDKLVISHDRGVYVSDGKRSYLVEGTLGVWKVIPIDGFPNHYLACEYHGLNLLSFKNGRFVFENRINGLDISSRDILQSNEPGVFWICHGYEGVYKIKIDRQFRRTVSLEHYTDQHGLPSLYNINIFTWQRDTVFVTNKGVYEFDATNKEFTPHERLSTILGDDLLIRKILDSGDKTWFIKDDELGYFKTNEQSPVLHKEMFLPLKGTFIKSLELVKPVGDSKVYVGTNDGLYSFNLNYESTTDSIPTNITEIKYRNKQNNLEFAPLQFEQSEKLELPYNTSSLIFNYASPQFGTKTGIQYSYILENIDQDWSEWSQSAEKEYSYLKSGNYIFKVKGRDQLGETSGEAEYNFEILPVWYQTKIAVVLFSLLGLIGGILLIILVKRKIKQTREEEAKLRKVLELELQQIKLEREKEKIIKDKEQLEEDVIHKSMELANYTMLLVKKRDLLNDMHNELKELKDSIKNERSRERVRSLTRKINHNLQDEEHLHVFDTNFERVHQDFFHELKSSYPDLTQKELRLCGFVKMNLTNKEIASILNISVRGVETARYRLRKRLSLSHEINMVDFLEKLSSSADDSTVEENDEEYLDR